MNRSVEFACTVTGTLVKDVRMGAAAVRRRGASGGREREAQELAEYGIVFLGRRLNREDALELGNEVMRIAEKARQLANESGRVTVRLGDQSYANVRCGASGRETYDEGMVDIFNVDELVPHAIAGAPLEEVVRLAGTAEGAEMRIANINAYVNEDVTNTRSYHMDSNRTQYKAFFYLTDVTELACGPFSYIQGSHKPNLVRYKNIVRNVFEKAPLTDMKRCRSTSEVVAFGSAGDGILSNQRGFHRGQPQGQGRRRVALVINIGLR